MPFGIRLLLAAVIILIINLPFGYWRGGLRKRSAAWFLAIHAPVPLVVGVRLILELGFAWSTIPVLVVAFGLGQWLGAWFRGRINPRRETVPEQS